MGVKLGLGKQSRVKVFENGMLRKIFGPKNDVVIWDWRKLYKEKLQEFIPL
jgi:hypothetical protein